MQSNRALTGGGGLGRSNTTTSTASSLTSRTKPPPSRSPSNASAFKKPPPPPPGSFNKESAAPPPPYTVGNGVAARSVVGKKPPPPPPLKPKPKVQPPKQYVIALYDFDAQADGDLSFRAGDRIEVVEKTTSSEDWWTGKLKGVQGVFPGRHLLFLEFMHPTESPSRRQLRSGRLIIHFHVHTYAYAVAAVTCLVCRHPPTD